MQCHPDCTRETAACRITLTQSYVREPRQEWTLIYDGAGSAITQDPNTYVNELTCTTCRRSWRVERTAGKEVVK